MKKIIFVLMMCVLGNIHSSQAQCDSTYFSTLIKNGQWAADFVWNSLVTISPEQEEQIGDEMHDNMGFPLGTDPQKVGKLNTILKRLLPYIEREGIQYDIHLIDDDDMINAFAIAGGHVYVTTGIMNWAESDDELAFIIGHEIAHVDLEHTVNQIKRNVSIQSIADYLQFGEYAGIAEQVQGTLGTPFGQVHEYTADRKGAYFVWKAGYNPSKGLAFFKRLMEMEPDAQERNDIEVFFRTHPFSDQRAECLQYFIDNELK